MTGFTEEEVREMLVYYSSVLPFNHSVDELIKVMKPWYDNYCFAEEEYGKTTMYNSVMVLNFIDKYIRNDYDIPDSMVDENIYTYIEKFLMDNNDNFTQCLSIMRQLITQNFVIGSLKDFIPKKRIYELDYFLSLLFYFGIVTIGGTYEGRTKFVIPNESIRKQIFNYLSTNTIRNAI